MERRRNPTTLRKDCLMKLIRTQSKLIPSYANSKIIQSKNLGSENVRKALPPLISKCASI